MSNSIKTRHDAFCEFRCSQILTAARKVFAAKGYREATMDEIAEAAGVAKGTLYAYFRSKQDVYMAELNRGGDELLELTRSALAAPGGLRARLAQFIRTRVEYLDQHSEFFKIYQSEIGKMTHPAWVNQQFRERYERQMEMLTGMVAEAMESGEIRAVPADAVACGICEMTRGLLLERVLKGAPRTAQAEAEVLAEVLWRGIKAAMSGMAVQLAATLSVSAQSPYGGSVPDPQAAGTAAALTLKDAIRLALKNNLGALVADAGARSARGQRMVALSVLKPQMEARVSQASIQANLAAYGFSSFPGISSIVWPYSLFDARAALSQQVRNLQSIHRSKAGTENERAAVLEAQDARDPVVLVATALYLDAVAGASRIEASEARVRSAQALYDQVVSYKQSGVVAGIEVLRAEVQLREQKQRLIAYRNEHEKQKLRLGRAIGLPDGTEVKLADKMPAGEATALPKTDAAISEALSTRMDFRSLQARVKAAEFAGKAASAERLPAIAFNADYGTMGPAPDNSH